MTTAPPDGKLFVLAKDKAATYADPKKTDPLANRANQGDCIAVTLPNEIPAATAVDKHTKTTRNNHHVHVDMHEAIACFGLGRERIGNPALKILNTRKRAQCGFDFIE